MGDPVASPPPPHPDEAETARRIDAFLTTSPASGSGRVPWPLDRARVSAAVEAQLAGTSGGALQAKRIADLSRVYLLEERVPDVLDHVGRMTDATAVAPRAWLLAIAGWLGSEQDRKAAALLLCELAESPDAWNEFETLIAARAALGPAVDTERFDASARAHLERLAERDDYDSEVLHDTLEEILGNDLEMIALADEPRARLSGLESTEAGALLLDIYLERGDYEGEEHLIPWAVLELRRRAMRDGPDGMRELFLAAGRPAGDRDPFVSVRALRAAAYFGAELDAAERQYIEENGSGQLDPLSRESLLAPFASVERPDRRDANGSGRAGRAGGRGRAR